jgi:hypothetical protein
MLIRLLNTWDTLPYPWPASVELRCLDTTYFQKCINMKVVLYYVVERIMQLWCWFFLFLTKACFALTYTYCTYKWYSLQHLWHNFWADTSQLDHQGWLIIWHRLEPVLLKFFLEYKSAGKYFESACPNCRHFSEKFFRAWKCEFTSPTFPTIPMIY